MRRASDPSAIHSGPPTESSHIMIMETFIIIAHSSMMKRKAFSRVDGVRSTVRGVTGLNIDIFMSIAGSVRRSRGRQPACRLFPFVFTIDHFNGLMLVAVGARFAVMLVFVVLFVLVVVVGAFAGDNCVWCPVGIARGRVTVGGRGEI